ncbi:hypothetical protein V8C44DRAFT_335091 [Trichoderma aethiopicum]
MQFIPPWLNLPRRPAALQVSKLPLAQIRRLLNRLRILPTSHSQFSGLLLSPTPVSTSDKPPSRSSSCDWHGYILGGSMLMLFNLGMFQFYGSPRHCSHAAMFTTTGRCNILFPIAINCTWSLDFVAFLCRFPFRAMVFRHAPLSVRSSFNLIPDCRSLPIP